MFVLTQTIGGINLLLNLHVKNFAIIDEIDVTFHDNLNILTGETGAGKSIIIGSINVALGGKISKDIIRKGAEYALVELVFLVEDTQILKRMEELDLPVTDGQIIITRKITNHTKTSSGKSLCKINGETVTATTLKEIAGLLIDIHGQHEHQSLLYKEHHLGIVDRYAKIQLGELKAQLSQEFNHYQNLKNKLNELKIDEDKRLREISFLEYEINEIKSASLKVGEDEILAKDYKRLSNAKVINEGLGHTYDMMSEQSESASENISRSVRQLSKLSEYDTVLGELYHQIIDIEALVSDFNRELSEYMNHTINQDEEFLIVEQRLNLINHLKAKYGNTMDDILSYCKLNESKLDQYNNYEETLKDITSAVNTSEKRLESLSEEVSTIRRVQSEQLENKIKEALIDLNFLEVKFAINIDQIGHYTSNGFDEAEFMISTNPGEEIKPLSKVASGGELSRIMLAIKSVLADKDEIETLIFDEIDVGVSGRTAQKVSEKLSVIANSHQVLCITHLPQIAAMSDSHYIIEKKTNGITTNTAIRNLTDEESIDEIARILGGAEITDTVKTSAKEMIDLAKKTKNFRLKKN